MGSEEVKGREWVQASLPQPREVPSSLPSILSQTKSLLCAPVSSGPRLAGAGPVLALVSAVGCLLSRRLDSPACLGAQEGWNGVETWVEEGGGAVREEEGQQESGFPSSHPLAGSLISLSEPNPSPFTYSTVRDSGWGRSIGRACNPRP